MIYFPLHREVIKGGVVTFPATLPARKRNQRRRRMESGSCLVLKENATQLGMERVEECRMVDRELLRRIGIEMEEEG